jgi:hypothetical protein
MAEVGRPDIMIVVGGVIPPGDFDELYAAGARRHLPARDGDRRRRDRLAEKAGRAGDDRPLPASQAVAAVRGTSSRQTTPSKSIRLFFVCCSLIS